MRLAIVVGSAYERNGTLSPLPSAELDGDLIERRLSEADAGFKVVRFAAERGLAERIEQRLLAQTTGIEQLLVYFSGYCVLSSERGPALLLDGERLGTFSLTRLKNLFLQFAPAACLVVDAAAVVDSKQPLGEVVDAIGGTLTAGAPSIVALVAARNSDVPDSFGGSAFTGLFLMVVDWLERAREATQPVEVRWIYDGLRADEQLWSEIPAAKLFGEQGFVLLPGADTERALPSLTSEPLPRFDFDSDAADLDEMLGLRPRRRAEEPSTEAAPAALEDDDEVTPTFRRASASEVPPSATTQVDAPEALPSFGAEDAPLAESAAEAPRAATPERALALCQQRARLAPLQAATYQQAYELFDALGSRDGAWNAASVLDDLGEADINESLLVSQHKPEGLLAARSTLENTDWSRALYREHDAELTRLLDALGVAAVRVGIGFAKHKGRYVAPDPGALQDPEKSTTMLAKTLAWSARLLGLAPPALYVLPDLEGGLEMAPTEHAAVYAARALGSGLGLGELAFLWGRHLPRCRQELRALSLFRSPSELAALLRAALALGGAQEIDVRAADADMKRLYAALRRELRGHLLDGLRGVVRSFTRDGLLARAEAAQRELELVGVRAGLLACGDVAVAAKLLRERRSDALLGQEALLNELYAYAISSEYLSLRERLGVAISA